jgi:predicted lysophospholipase L1 biosynthesis ABC-type transport system permease subunit
MDPLGRLFSRGIDGEQGFEVVGIAADARTTSLERTPPLMVYVPLWWRSRPSTDLLIKSAYEPSELMPAVRRAIRSLDPEIALGEPVSVQQLIDRSTASRRYQMKLFVVFGSTALFIAVVGVYAVTAYGISGRRREMNIRSALGASRRQVVAMVVRRGIRTIGIGVAAGAAGAAAAGRVVAALLFEVRSGNPVVLAGVTTAVGAVALCACLFAALKTLAIDPSAALRDS